MKKIVTVLIMIAMSIALNTSVFAKESVEEGLETRSSWDQGLKDYNSDSIPPWRKVVHEGEGKGVVVISGTSKESVDLIVKITKSGGDKEGEYIYSTNTGEDWSETILIRGNADIPLNKTGEKGQETGIKIRFLGDDFRKDDIYQIKTNIEYVVTQASNLGDGQIAVSSEDIIYNDSYKIVLKVTKSGGLKKGRIKYSLDNGITFKSDVLIPEDGKLMIPGTQICIWFYCMEKGFLVGDQFTCEIKGDMSKRDYSPYIIGFILVIGGLGVYFLNELLKKKENDSGYVIHVYEPITSSRKKGLPRRKI